MTANYQTLTKKILSLPDPLKIRRTAYQVIKNSQFVSIDFNNLKPLAKKIKKQIKNQKLLTSNQFGQLQNSPQKIFLLDTVNFCFWANKDQPRWQIEYPQGKIADGWQALIACFDRAIDNQIPLLDSRFLNSLTLKQTQKIFKSNNRIPIPLIKKRHQFLKQTGKTLLEKYQGQTENLLKKADFEAIKLIKLILKDFPHFKDPFLKRAQICAYDFALLPKLKISNTQILTIFADYKLPQVLRSLKAFKYSPSLAKKIDQFILIPKNSRQETEIRASTIWAGELLSQIIQKPPALIDNALWLLSQKEPQTKTYHRTLTTNY